MRGKRSVIAYLIQFNISLFIWFLKENLPQNQLKDIPNSRLYSEMRELDLRIEQYTNRKKAEIFDLDQHHQLQTRTLRLHLYNQHFNQSGVDPNATPSWSFFIYGQFLDQDHALRSLALQGQDADKKVASRFWTTAMSSIEIKTSSPDSDNLPVDVYRWQKNRHVGQHKEGIEIHRHVLYSSAHGYGSAQQMH